MEMLDMFKGTQNYPSHLTSSHFTGPINSVKPPHYSKKCYILIVYNDFSDKNSIKITFLALKIQMSEECL